MERSCEHKNPEESFRLWKKGSVLCVECFSLIRDRLKLKAKVSSIVSLSKKSENELSNFLFGYNRDWKEQHDLSGSGLCIEVKSYSWSLVGQRGGVWEVLRDALEQCKGVAPEGTTPVAILRIKGTNISKSYCTLDGQTLITLEALKNLIDSREESSSTEGS